MTQKVRFMIEAIHKSFFECLPSQGPSIATLIPLPPLPSFIFQVHDTHTKLSRIIQDVIQCEILLHLCYPYGRVRAIKFIHVQLRWSSMGLLVDAKEVKRLTRLTLTIFIANIFLLACFHLHLESVAFKFCSCNTIAFNVDSIFLILSLTIA